MGNQDLAGMDTLILDLARTAHLLFLAIGIGVAVFAEFTVLQRAALVIDAEDFRLIEGAHGIITVAVVGLWVTGLSLFVMVTGLSPELITAKLVTKLIVVAILTANMVAIDRFAMPVLRGCKGRNFGALPSAVRLRLGALGGMSAGCWGAALLLGRVSAFRELGVVELFCFVAPVLLITTLAGALSAETIGRRAPDLA